MDISETRVLLQGVAKLFEARLKSKPGTSMGCPNSLPQHIVRDVMCDAYTSHVVEALKSLMLEIPSREVKKAFHIAWPNIVGHIEDEASSELDKKVEWYSNCHDNLTDNVRMAENKASAE